MRGEASKNFGPRPRHRSSKRSSAARIAFRESVALNIQAGWRKEVQETFAPVLT
jgi:hypothetical protein